MNIVFYGGGRSDVTYTDVFVKFVMWLYLDGELN